MTDTIIRAAIHPAIGIARVGNSKEPGKDGYFIGPETPDEDPPDFFRDSKNAIKRQAARFRVYGYNAQGEAVRELKASDTDIEITWSVHLANRKGDWYEFSLALDVPEGQALDPATNFHRRNRTVTNRADLVIDAGRQDISASSSSRVPLNKGKFMGTTVSLGDLETDESGRLIVLGGDGHSASPKNVPLNHFANNDGWYDTTSDGPVTATVTIGGKPVPVDPAWVVVGPPNYAPQIKTLRTVHDLLHDVFVQTGAIPFPEKVSFHQHIKPILRRFCDMQWVNKGFATHFGWEGPEHFLSPAMLARLGSTEERHRNLRRQIYLALRDYDRDGTSALPWPWFYGDGMARRPRSPRQHMTLSPTQDKMMELWSEGNFDPDHKPPQYKTVDDAPLKDRPALLDRAALDFCLADAFHPGCEVTWPVRHASMYMAPFRIRHRNPAVPEPSYGPQLLPKQALAPNGPLYAQGPGGLTRWMAIPWQSDAASCRWGYESTAGMGPRYDPHLPTFWPARVPNHVLKEADYKIVNSTKPETESQEAWEKRRAEAFERRAVWLRGLKGSDQMEQVRQMVSDWYKLGIVEPRTYTGTDGKYPAQLHVEITPFEGFYDAPDNRNLYNLHVPQAGRTDLSARQAADTVAQAIAEFTELTGLTEDEVAAGYLDKFDPFGDDR